LQAITRQLRAACSRAGARIRARARSPRRTTTRHASVRSTT
jgi:hypothetical protein